MRAKVVIGSILFMGLFLIGYPCARADSNVQYSIDVSTTQQVSHEVNASIGVTDKISLLGKGSLVNQLSQYTIYGASAGFTGNVTDFLSFQMMAAATSQTNQASSAGGSLSTTFIPSTLWQDELRTMITVELGYMSPTKLFSFDLLMSDPSLFSSRDSVGLYQELNSSVMIGVAYSYFGYLAAGTSADSVMGLLQIQIHERLSTQLTFTEFRQDGILNPAGAANFTWFTPSKRFSVGGHASVFSQEKLGESSSSATTTTKALTTTGPAGTPPDRGIGWSTGLDLGLYW